MLLLEAILPGGTRPTLRSLAGVLIGFAGVLMLLWPDRSGTIPALNPWGAAALVFATMAWAFGSIISRYLRLPASPMMGTAVEMLAGGTALLLMSAVAGEFSKIQLSEISVNSMLGLGYLIVFGALVGFTAYTWLLRVAPTSLVGTYAYVNPLVALVVGTWIGKEAFSARMLIAALIILGSVALITTTRKVKK
jgi:drug/metabolite transporter (DMT)-like permease